MRGNSPVPSRPRDSLRAFSGCHDPVCPRVLPRDCGSSSYRTPRHMPAAVITTVFASNRQRTVFLQHARLDRRTDCSVGPPCGSAQQNGVNIAPSPLHPNRPLPHLWQAARSLVHLVPRRFHARDTAAAGGATGMVCTLLRCASPHHHRCVPPRCDPNLSQAAQLSRANSGFFLQTRFPVYEDLTPACAAALYARGRTTTRDTTAVDDTVRRLLPPPCGGDARCARKIVTGIRQGASPRSRAMECCGWCRAMCSVYT
jgi:hypothetical protein